MKRESVLGIFFICWGLVILAAGVWIITQKRGELHNFSSRVASKNVLFYPLRASILDRNGRAVCFSKWEIYFVFPERRASTAKKFCTLLGIEYSPVKSAKAKYMQQNIPDEKITDAVKNAKKYRIRLRRRPVRCTAELPLSVKNVIGLVAEHDGISGIEKKYNDTLKGVPGFYNVMLGPDGRIEEQSFQVISPMREAQALELSYSLEELQNPFIAWRLWL